MVSLHFFEVHERGNVEGKEREVYSGQQTGVIGVKPTVKMQSASVAPGIATAPPSVGQVPMTDDVPTGSVIVSVDVSILPAEVGLGVC